MGPVGLLALSGLVMRGIPLPGARQVPTLPLIIVSPGAPLGCGSWQPSPLMVLRMRFLLELEKAALCFPGHGPGALPGGGRAHSLAV